ncbi:adenosine deaminase [Alteromonas sp. CYL-A6]|uniref:adenosine deaminase n=1 Tax=Alteromonas nitratireducens TaxID=3390813 RepID=UPI0034B1FDCF
MVDPELPLIDLHRHLDGNVRPATIFDLAVQHDLPLKGSTVNEVAHRVQIQDKTSDLLAFIGKLEHGMSVLADADACRRIGFENVEDAYREGLDYCELRFSPVFMASAFSLSLDDVIDAVIDGVSAGTKAYPVDVNLIGILSRTYGPARCNEELDALLRRRDALVAIDLAGDEAGFPGDLFITHFRRVRDAGLGVTVHAGEADGPASIWQAINVLGANRIGHGVAAIQDPALMEQIAQRQIGIETCLTSNYQTGAFTDTTNHPITSFLSAGMPVTLNTDDPGISAITLKSEFTVAHTVCGLTPRQLRQCQTNSLDQAFLSDAGKTRLRQQRSASTRKL